MPHRQGIEPALDVDAEYRAIEAALIETARGRWFLTEHSRRSRRLETVELEEALAKLKSSLREPPALLGRLQTELNAIASQLEAARRELLSRESATAHGTGPATPALLLDAAELLHEQAWQLQTSELDSALCERIGRQTAVIFAMSARQAQESRRSQRHAASLDAISSRVAAVLKTIVQEASEDAVPMLADNAT